ncbi:MAG: alpha-amylase family glycosyl hydrolase [Candidatus Zhuqueibacterota bacterium]
MKNFPKLEKYGVVYREPLSHLSSRPSPAWVRHGIIYEVYVRDFCAQGNFSGFLEHLPELKELGVTIIWFMPIFPIGKKGRKGTLGCPYSISDYYSTNPEYGTKEDFKRVVDGIHEAGMRVIIDMVANHAANDHVAMGVHPDWFSQDENGEFTRRIGDWSDATDLNYSNPGLWKHMKEALLYWVREFHIDGYRCDVAGMVPENFWQEARKALNEQNPDLLMLAEWEDPRMHVFSFDSTYDWILYYTYLDVFKSNAPAEHVIDLLLQRKAEFPKDSLRLRFIENHDEKRAMHIFGAECYKPFAAFIFTIDGIPLIYNGQEVGEPNFSSLFEKEPIDWNRPGGDDVFNFYKFLIGLRAKHPVLVDGDIAKIKNDQPGAVVSFLRSNEQDQQVLVAINFSTRKVTTTLETDIASAKTIIQVNQRREVTPQLKGQTLQLDANDSLILVLKA